MTDLREIVDRGPMRGFQYLAVLVCILLNMIDGFDVLVMAFTAASVSREWGLSGAQVGLLLSAGLVGMAAGSLLLAPLADRWGRRRLILVCLLLSGSGMLQLAPLRGLTGLCGGGVLASSNVIASEYSAHRWRGLAVSLQGMGYALGATLGGLLAVWLLSHWGWRAVFCAGGLITLGALPLVLLGLPESLDFLLTRRPVGALVQVNRLARRLGQPELAALPPQMASPGAAGTVGRLLAPALRRTTLLVWTLFFLAMFGFYFIMSWTPKLLTTLGLSEQQGVAGGVLLSVGGIFGAALVGLLFARLPLSRALGGFMLTTALLLVAFAHMGSSYLGALAMGLLIGLFANGCVAGLYALPALAYAAEVRATGVGWGIGIGRLGAILSPVVAGLLLDNGWPPLRLYLVFAGVFVAAGLLLLLTRPEGRPTPAGLGVSAGKALG